MTNFNYMASLIHKGFCKIGYGELYERFWNPLNYAIIGGIGMLINWLVCISLIGSFPWWITSALGILTGWMWNWSMSVGPFGYLWGFSKKKGASSK